MKFVTQRRIHAAQSLLFHTHLPVSAIGALIGYAHVAQFSMVFKRISGFSPLQYRQQQRLEKPRRSLETGNRSKSVNRD